MTFSQEAISHRTEEVLQFYRARLQNSGATMEQFLELYHLTLDELKEKLKPEIIDSLKIDAEYDYIIKQEGFVVTEEEIASEADRYLKQRGADVAKDAFLAANRANIERTLLQRKVSDFLYEQNN